MAGIAAMMRSRKERQGQKKKRHESLPGTEETGFAEVVSGKTREDGLTGASTTITEKSTSIDKSPSKLVIGDQPAVEATTKKGEKKLEGESKSIAKTREQRLIEHIQTESYTPVYMGFVFISIGLVITFVGLGDKGFRTTELRLIGPSLCFFGLCCILYKIMQCHFPRLFVTPFWLKKARLADSNPDTSILIESGLVKSIHVGTSVVHCSPVLSPTSPRVILQSAPQVPRPKSSTTATPSIPNYIEDSSDDDFDSGRRSQPRPPPPPHRPLAHHQSYDDKRHPAATTEIILDPKQLKL